MNEEPLPKRKSVENLIWTGWPEMDIVLIFKRGYL